MSHYFPGILTSIVFLMPPLMLTGCGDDSGTNPKYATDASHVDGSEYGDSYYDDYYNTGVITFADELTSNVDMGDELRDLTFTNVDGERTTAGELAGDRHLVLVITRGNTNPICPYCTAQTSRLIANYEEFRSRDAEVVVVYPIEQMGDVDQLESFLETSRQLIEAPDQAVPFPILLDVELQAVDLLGIRKDLSKPATYIIDPSGKVTFAYVGARLDDRPSIKAMFGELDKLAESSISAELTPAN